MSSGEAVFSSIDLGSSDYGTYDVVAYADGDESNEVSVSDVTFDGGDPEISSSSPTGATDNNAPDIEASFEDSVSGLASAWIYFDASGDEANESEQNLDVDSETLEIDFSDYDFDDLDDDDGYTIEWSATDQAGNSNSGEWEFTVDTEYDGDSNPSFSVEDESDGVIDFDEDKDVEVDFGDADSETDTAVTCIVDGVEVDSFTVEARDDDPSESSTTCEIDHDEDEPYYDSMAEIYLEMEDEAGNSETSDTEEIGFDSGSPYLPTLEASSGVSVFNDDFEMSYEALDNVAGIDYVDYTVDDSDGVQLNEASGEFTVNTEGLEEGRHELKVQPVDELGKIGSSESFEFDFYPDESPELKMDVQDELTVTEGNTETVDITLSNSGRIVVPAGTLEVSELGESQEFDQVLPGESQTVSIDFSPTGDDLGEHQVEFSATTADESAGTSVVVEASEETRQNIQSETDTYVGDYEDLLKDVESTRSGLSEERTERLNEDFSEFEASVQELESAVENEEYYRADDVLEDLNSQMQSAQDTFEEVQREQSVADRNRMIIFAFVLLFAILGGGAGFLVYSDDYDIKVPDLEQLTGNDDDPTEDAGYSHLEEDDEEEGLVEKIKSKIEGLTGEEKEGDSDEPGYEFK